MRQKQDSFLFNCLQSFHDLLEHFQKLKALGFFLNDKILHRSSVSRSSCCRGCNRLCLSSTMRHGDSDIPLAGITRFIQGCWRSHEYPASTSQSAQQTNSWGQTNANISDVTIKSGQVSVEQGFLADGQYRITLMWVNWSYVVLLARSLFWNWSRIDEAFSLKSSPKSLSFAWKLAKCCSIVGSSTASV